MTETASAHDILSEALGLPEADITEDMTLETSPAWDSLAHLRVVLAIEAAIGRPLEPEEVFSIDGVSDVANILECAK